MNWFNHINYLKYHMRLLSVHDDTGQEIDPDAAFGQWQKTTKQIRENQQTVYLIGNGASASMASHFAADLAKNAHVHTEVFSDLSLITAIANDLSYEEVFAEPLRRRMLAGEMLVAISSSGQSKNIIRAVNQAKSNGGLVITLSAMESKNMLRTQGVLNFYVPAMSYGMAETCHAAILHYWIDQMVAKPVGREYLSQVKILEM